MERYVVLRATLEQLYQGIPLRKYFFFKRFHAVETVTIDLENESVTYGDDDHITCVAFGTSYGRTIYCEDFEEDHHDQYPLTVMLIRAVGVTPPSRYYMTELLRGIVGNRHHRHPLFEKQLLRVVVGFL